MNEDNYFFAALKEIRNLIWEITVLISTFFASLLLLSAAVSWAADIAVYVAFVSVLKIISVFISAFLLIICFIFVGSRLIRVFAKALFG